MEPQVSKVVPSGVTGYTGQLAADDVSRLGGSELAAATPWTEMYPAGVDPDLRGRWTTMIEAWEATVARLGTGAPAVHYFDRTLTFGEMDEASDRLARGLCRLGFKPGDRLAIYLQNDPQWVIGALAAWKCGGIVACVNPMNRDKELRHILNDSGARLVLALVGLLPIVHAVAAETSIEAVIVTSPHDFAPGALGASVVGESPTGWSAAGGVPTHAWSEVISGERVGTRESIDGDSVALLTYTSGTTGQPKGAMNLHRNLAHSAEVYNAWFALDEHDVVLGIAPLFHITGAVAGMCLTITTGAPLILLHRFDAKVTLKAITRHRATFTIAASSAFIALISSETLGEVDVSTLTKVASGGAPVSPALVERIRGKTGWDVRGVYGMTETTSPTHLAPIDQLSPVDPASGALAVGIPVPGAQIRIVDVETGAPLGPGSEGEIIVKGPMVIPGYWENHQETAHAIRDGWLYTGDVGIMDEHGWTFIVDRKKDLINAGGYKVWPREVEDVLYEHAAVREAAVVGVTDDYRGETVKAFVTLVPGTSVTPEEIVAFTRERMAAYKRPTQVEILEEIPTNASGKILRRELRSTC